MASKYVPAPEKTQQPTRALLLHRHRVKMRKLKVYVELIVTSTFFSSLQFFAFTTLDNLPFQAFTLLLLKHIGNVLRCQHSKEAASKVQNLHTIKNTKGTKTSHRCPCPFKSKHDLKLDTKHERTLKHHEKPKWLNCFVQGCQQKSCFNEEINLPIRYPSPKKPCVPEHVHPRPPLNWNRRPPLFTPPEMLNNLKRGIRNPFQITHRRKEMQTRLDRLTDEHQAFAFPPGTKPLRDNYYFIDPPLSLVENYDIICRDIHMQKFLECSTRSSLLVFNGDKYKFFRERLPIPQKRILNIPGNSYQNNALIEMGDPIMPDGAR
ncbi:uncharacterized protein LOC124310504 isoform X1 [Neodiprion virginianus]|uniref:uncharacterized protein LOC124310504 isoform X1 n=1 Tax=Neodiprion virginianus TaxID=2961670 RepID=UPI001EE698B8|nr:uncharacterized protein LOC124310504 isoform X1 [Neodiprion virginianus]